jgi:hypothetical protein
MLIFDNFDSREDAEKFAEAVKEKHNREAFIYDTREAFNAVDIFPSVLIPPIVCVERPITDDPFEIITEAKIEEMVVDFNGEFAGT